MKAYINIVMMSSTDINFFNILKEVNDVNINTFRMFLSLIIIICPVNIIRVYFLYLLLKTSKYY